MKDYMKILSENILSLRKKLGMTQESLGEKLGISFQAVSKWENGLSCPDVLTLPEPADIFGVSTDTLFGRNADTNKENMFSWEDDPDTVYPAAFRGDKLLEFSKEDNHDFVFKYDGEPKNVYCRGSLECSGDINGIVNAERDIECKGDIIGNANAGKDIRCDGDIIKDANAGCNISCGDIIGNAKAGVDISCGGDISDDAWAGVSIR